MSITSEVVRIEWEGVIIINRRRRSIFMLLYYFTLKYFSSDC
jgi:hypothetical protein